MRPDGPDRSASIRQRLVNGARARLEDPQFVLQRYAAERFLYRLGQSPHRDRFVLKGATLFALWGGAAFRPTRDLDFAGYGSPDHGAVLQAVAEICGTPGGDDGVMFDHDELRTVPIREDTEYGGLRIEFVGRLGRHTTPMRLDIGFGDAVQPPPQWVDFPSLLEAPAPRIRAYPKEAVVAEKLHAMVFLGERNGRLKDYYDLCRLAQYHSFAGDTLARSIAVTFAQRRTPITTSQPAALTVGFYGNVSRTSQWNAFLLRNGLGSELGGFEAVGALLRQFLAPPLACLAAGLPFSVSWPAGGPWLGDARGADSPSPGNWELQAPFEG